MEALGISQAALARKLGVDKSSISRILNGHSNLTVRTLIKVCIALDALPRIQVVSFRTRFLG